MSNTICFDRVAEAKNILKAGIGGTNTHARSELRTAAWYLVNKTTYTTKQIENRLRNAAADYFKGMPETYTDACIHDIISSVKQEQGNDDSDEISSSITIYKEELEHIRMLCHDDTERLAFVFLCIAKMLPYEQIYECNSKLYRLAWRYKYDADGRKVIQKQEGRRVGGKEPTKRVNRLCQAGIVRYATRINTPYRQSSNRPTASATFSVPILRKDGEVAFIIDKPDEESLVLYYDRYKGYGGIVTCEQCGKPVFRTGRRQKYCSTCADIVSHHPEKRDL